MRMRNNEIILNGYYIILILFKYSLGRKLVKEGLSDFTVKIGNERVESVKIIFIGANKILKALLEDKQFSGTLELVDGCSCKGFLELEKYYSSGDMEITTENVCEILLLSVCYNDQNLKDACTQFIKIYYNDEIIIGLVKLINRFHTVAYLEEFASTEFEKRGYKYLYNGILLHILLTNRRMAYDVRIE